MSTPAAVKRALLDDLVRILGEAAAAMKKAADTAHDAATHEEMKPENDKDTRGIEAGYLAGAQSARAAELQRTIAELRALTPRSFAADDPVGITALVELVDTADERARRLVFVCPHGAGTRLKAAGGREAQVVTPDSPLGDAVVGKRAGDVVELHAGGRVRELEIVRVS